MKPTSDTYTELQVAYDFFNQRLFDGRLPDCLLTLQREKRCCGYFSAQRFQDRQGRFADEIAINPAYFPVVPLVEVMQTLVHEMCHLWQFHFGKPGRGRYHNLEWANQMEALGLMPSSTGQPGGDRTGDSMADYPIAGGPFLGACTELLSQAFRISWYDRFPASHAADSVVVNFDPSPDLPEALLDVPAESTVQGGYQPAEMPANKSNRSKYSCHCGFNLWGKPGLQVICGVCQQTFAETG